MSYSNVGVSYEAYKKLEQQRNELKDQLDKEKIDHTYTQAKIVFAMHILQGNRDESVKEFISNREQEIKELEAKLENIKKYIH